MFDQHHRCIYTSKKRDSATMDVYIRPIIQAQIPCTCIYVLMKAVFPFTWSFASV